MSTRVFRYRALRRDGSVARGELEAPNAPAAVSMLAREALFPSSLADLGEARHAAARMSTAQMGMGLRILAEFVEAGLSLPRALDAFIPLAPSGWAPALPRLRQGIREGHGFAAALGASGVRVPALVLGLLEAGESGPGLAGALRRASELMERSAAFSSSVRAALAYPALLAVTGVGAMGMLIGVVLPRFAGILHDLGQPLPASTRFVIATGGLLGRVAMPALALAVGVAALWRAWVATDAGRAGWHGLLLQLPVVGSLRLLAATSRAAHALAALLASGVALPASLELAARASGDGEVALRLRRARADVLQGVTLSLALATHAAMTPTAVDLLRAGEQAGRVPGMLMHAAGIEQERVERRVRAAVKLLEPLLVLAMASAVALVAASLLQAVYGIRPT